MRNFPPRSNVESLAFNGIIYFNESVKSLNQPVTLVSPKAVIKPIWEESGGVLSRNSVNVSCVATRS